MKIKTEGGPIMRDGFIKVAAGTPKIKVADCEYNAGQIIALMKDAADHGVKVLALPELCITGYTCGDLFLQDTLLRGAEDALSRILEETSALDMLAAVGLPVWNQWDSKLYNCAVVINRGKILGLFPKIYIPNYGEFYEGRWFASGRGTEYILTLCGQRVNMDAYNPVILDCKNVPNLTVGVEICEDLWAASPPSNRLALSGATVILNLSASNEVVGKASYRRQLVTDQSARLVCGYVYADAGEGESTTDLVFAGHNIIAENGVVLAEKRFSTGLTISEIDVDRLAHERQRMTSFGKTEGGSWQCPFSLDVEETHLTRHITKNPFVPEDAGDRQERYEEIFKIAALGLKKRLEHTHASCAVVGLSGGLDSTLALLITARAMEMLNRPKTDILAVTMPCFGTTSRTKSNAQVLAEHIGADFRTVDIGEAVKVHFRDIGQSMEDLSVTFENAQARERTQVLMDLANQRGGMVIGTGDLSELALGWATYNGDHMSMYGVNGSIPKTLVRHLTAYAAGEAQQSDPQLAAVLRDILATPVSPELLPPKEGEIAQKTEDLVGPYELHDFFLYYAIRWGFGPRKVFRLALAALEEDYGQETILKWLKNFYRRFFTQQFKRSCLPDGPKVGSLALSPRGDWRMPSDAVNALWMKELETL